METYKLRILGFFALFPLAIYIFTTWILAADESQLALISGFGTSVVCIGTVLALFGHDEGRRLLHATFRLAVVCRGVFLLAYCVWIILLQLGLRLAWDVPGGTEIVVALSFPMLLFEYAMAASAADAFKASTSRKWERIEAAMEHGQHELPLDLEVGG